MPTSIHAAGPTGQRSPGLDAAIAGYLAENGGGGGVELVSGVVDLDGTGSPVREFYCTASATIEGVAFAAGTAVVFRRTPAGVWGYIVVDPWTDIAGTTTTTTTAATTTTTTTAATTTTTTAATTTTTTTTASGPLVFRGNASSGVDNPAGGTYTFAAQPIGTESAARLVVVGVAWNTASASPIETVTIGGVSATLIGTGSTEGSSRSAMAYAVVPTGTTADVVVDFVAGTIYRAGVGVWTLEGGTFSSGVSDQNYTGASKTLNVTAVAGGAVICCASPRGIVQAHTWTGVTESYDLSALGGEAVSWTGAAAYPTTAGSLAVTCTPETSGFNTGSMIVAAFSVV